MKISKREYWPLTLMIFLGMLLITQACKIDQGRIDVTLKKGNVSKISNITISNVQFNNHQLIITGTNLSSVT